MPAGALTQSIFTPAAATTRHAACVTSGPMPSPSINTICMGSPQRWVTPSECRRATPSASRAAIGPSAPTRGFIPGAKRNGRVSRSLHEWELNLLKSGLSSKIAPRNAHRRRLMDTTVRATCPKCRTTLKIPAQWLGQAVKCKKCGAVVRSKPAAQANGTVQTPPPAANAFDFAQPAPKANGDWPLPEPLIPAEAIPDNRFDPTGGADAAAQPPAQPVPGMPGYPYPVPPGYPA